MPDNHYEDATLAALYDIQCGWSKDRDFYLELAGDTPISVLDLGCGTGLLCDAYAEQGHDVTGVDPAPAMLEIARHKPNGARIDWVEATAGGLRTSKQFDLIIMTGHAFQVLLTDEEVAACFGTMRHHLAPGGRAVFESRNPVIDWPSRWTGDTIFERDGQNYTVSRQAGPWQGDRLGFETRYLLEEGTLFSRSVLRFMGREAIAAQIAHAGLHLAALYGDWDHAELDPARSEEMIFEVGAG